MSSSTITPDVVDSTPARRPASVMALLFAAGAAMSITLGVYGRVHEPTNRKIFQLGFSGMPNMKIWLASVAMVLGLLQLLSALTMWNKLPLLSSRPKVVAPLHRWAGTLAFVVTIPIAYHCLWSIGFNTRLAGDAHDPRRLIHSLAGCLFYGAFTTKMLSLRTRRLPRWMLPVVGGLTFTALVIVWTTSSLWWFTRVEFPAF